MNEEPKPDPRAQVAEAHKAWAACIRTGSHQWSGDAGERETCPACKVTRLQVPGVKGWVYTTDPEARNT